MTVAMSQISRVIIVKIDELNITSDYCENFTGDYCENFTSDHCENHPRGYFLVCTSVFSSGVEGRAAPRRRRRTDGRHLRRGRRRRPGAPANLTASSSLCKA
jgi:hypothetical protein